MRRLAAVMLTLVGVPLVGYALLLTFGSLMTMGTCSPTAPICRASPPGFVLAFALITAVGLVQIVIAVGIWKSRRCAQILGLLLSAGCLVICLIVALTAFRPIGAAAIGPRGEMVPIYEDRSIAIAVAAIPYAIALVALVVQLMPRRRETS